LVIKLSMLCVEVKVEYSKVKVRIRLILKLYFLSNFTMDWGVKNVGLVPNVWVN